MSTNSVKILTLFLNLWTLFNMSHFPYWGALHFACRILRSPSFFPTSPPFIPSFTCWTILFCTGPGLYLELFLLFSLHSSAKSSHLGPWLSRPSVGWWLPNWYLLPRPPLNLIFCSAPHLELFKLCFAQCQRSSSVWVLIIDMCIY